MPRRVPTVTVRNSSKRASLHLGRGSKLGPGETNEVPVKVWKRVKGKISWLEEVKDES